MTAITKAVYDKMIASKKARNVDDASYYGYMYSVATKAEKDGEDIVKAFRKEIKALKDNIQYARSKTELDNINYQISLYDEFMPKELTDEELNTIIDKALTGIELIPKNRGLIMKTVMSAVAGRADGKRVSAMVSKLF